MPLSHFDIQNAKPEAKPYKLADGGGLFLLIQPNGSKLWRLKYRHHGTERSLSFGTYPACPSPTRARNATKRRKLIAKASTPRAQEARPHRRRDRRAQHLRLDRRRVPREPGERTVRPPRRSSKTNGCSKTSPRRSPTADRRDHRRRNSRPLKRVEKSGRRETARRLRGVMGAVFRLAVVTLRAHGDPTYAFKARCCRPTRNRAQRSPTRGSSARSCARSTTSTAGRRSGPR